ncbi:MAG: succinylglutamate desuccinylase/aspartoacylase family protein [Woeseia sp.]
MKTVALHTTILALPLSVLLLLLAPVIFADEPPADGVSEVAADDSTSTLPEAAQEDELEADGIELPAHGPGLNPEEAGLAITGPEEIAEHIAQDIAARTMTLLGGAVPAGTYQRLSWAATELFEGVPISTPVLVVNGLSPGPTLCLTAAVHGDELNGIEMVRRVMHDLDPKKLSGAVIGVPIVNLQGFRSGSRYLPDRRDLNRYFPGNPNGSAASRIAYSFFTQVIRKCDALIDLHTGSFDRANLPQLRADLRNPEVVTLTHGFGATVILHSDPAQGTLRHAASAAGIATVTLEAGGPSELELREVMHGVKGIETLLNTLGMVKKIRLWGNPEPVYYHSVWVRADRGGILLADVSLGSTVRQGDLLGTITDPMNNASAHLYAPFSGRVIGMARNQVVMPGFAAFHVGIETADPGAAGFRYDSSDDSLAHDAEMTNDDYIDGMSE